MNKRILALLIAAAVTTGMGGFGTVAYLSDKAQVNDQISITMGTLDVEANWYDGWKQTANETSKVTESTINGSSITNVKPGEEFYRDVVIKNIGSLNASTEIILNEIYNNENLTVTCRLLTDKVNIITVDPNKTFKGILSPGVECKLRLKIKINSNVEENTVSEILNATTEEIFTVTAKQISR